MHPPVGMSRGSRTAAVGVGLVASVLSLACRGGDSEPQAEPPGADRAPVTRALEAGSTVMQDVAPVGQLNVYLSGFHPMKADPKKQMEANHYCNQVNEDFAQCVLFDGNTSDANLNGVEYIISEKLYASLPADERQYWHPHNYEILSGQLIAPGIPEAAEKELMRRKINSYGKTWHLWDTGSHGVAGQPLPLGAPMLAWSFTKDGEAVPGLVEQRDRQLGVSTVDRRRDRADLAALAKPQ